MKDILEVIGIDLLEQLKSNYCFAQSKQASS